MKTEFVVNQWVFDMQTKEHVKISNGIPIVENGQETRFLKPTEAIALRVIGLNKGKPQIAFTYRKVAVEHLRSLTTGEMADFEAILASETKGNGTPEHYEFIGRI